MDGKVAVQSGRRGGTFSLEVSLLAGKDTHFPAELGALRVLMVTDDASLATNIEQIVEPCGGVSMDVHSSRRST